MGDFLRCFLFCSALFSVSIEALNKEKKKKHIKFHSIGGLVRTTLHTPEEPYGAKVWLFFFEHSFPHNTFFPFPGVSGYQKTWMQLLMLSKS